jgi:predicted alpha/beta-hydrolase family hydrolase
MSVGGGTVLVPVMVSADIACSLLRRLYARAVVILGHGASGTAESMRPHVVGLRARGVDATAIDLPKGRAERAVDVLGAAARPLGGAAVVGGHSYGGRVASLYAAREPVAGLVLFSYPLHRPGHPEEQRTEHWPAIHCPVLLLSGESDPFARIDLLRAAVPLLARGELITYPRIGHGLLPVLDDALDHIARFVRSLGSTPRPSATRR